MAGQELPKGSRPGGWHFRARIDVRGPFDFDSSFSDLDIEQIRQRLKPPRGRPPAPYKWEWARRFEEIKAEYLERYECHHVDGERPPNDMDFSLAVAYDDFAEHPERWKYDPDEKQDTAAHRVWDLVCPLLELNKKTLRRAAEIRRERRL